jgi:hypothetical protein
MRPTIITTLFAAFALTTAAPPANTTAPPATTAATIAVSPPSPPPVYNDAYPGGSLLLVSEAPGQRPVEFRQPVDINAVTPIDPPRNAIQNITHIKFLYFLNVLESKVECHAYKDKAALQPFRVPFTKARPLELKWNDGVVEVMSVLCIVVV